MKRAKPGKRHLLLMYQHSMSRLWKYTFFLTLMLFIPWLMSYVGVVDTFDHTGRWMLLGTAIVSLALTLFLFASRKMSYVQAHANHLRLVTPFLRMKISYKRVRSIHPANLSQLFPPAELKWSQRSAVEPFYGQTALVVDLTGFPLSPVLLRLFLSPFMFSPNSLGLVFVVSDWMALSTEADSLRSGYSHGQSRQAARYNPGRA